MQKLGKPAFDWLLAESTVLESDSHGSKVLRLSDGCILKLFRRRRLLSSELLFSKACRFARNCEKLSALRITCPRIIEVWRIPSIRRHGVLYAAVPGDSLRHLVSQHQADQTTLRSLAELIARLHALGVYFRSLHLGNVIVGSDGRLGLIDIADMHFKHGPLSLGMRLRNFRHLLRAPRDRQWVLGTDSLFFRYYLEAAGLEGETQRFIQRFDSLATMSS
jgi:tRNA A-37 threonylcarbamoyl transferase component Bud32